MICKETVFNFEIIFNEPKVNPATAIVSIRIDKTKESLYNFFLFRYVYIFERCNL